MTANTNERTLAGLAHASILFGFVTNGIGGIGAALVVWITQKDKSAFVAFQSLQALVYQVVTFILVFTLFGCWGILWVLMILPPLIANPAAFDAAPPPSMWVGLGLMVIPFGVWLLTTAYGLWGASAQFPGPRTFATWGLATGLSARSKARSMASQPQSPNYPARPPRNRASRPATAR